MRCGKKADESELGGLCKADDSEKVDQTLKADDSRLDGWFDSQGLQLLSVSRIAAMLSFQLVLASAASKLRLYSWINKRGTHGARPQADHSSQGRAQAAGADKESEHLNRRRILMAPLQLPRIVLCPLARWLIIASFQLSVNEEQSINQNKAQRDLAGFSAATRPH